MVGLRKKERTFSKIFLNNQEKEDGTGGTRSMHEGHKVHSYTTQDVFYIQTLPDLRNFKLRNLKRKEF